MNSNPVMLITSPNKRGRTFHAEKLKVFASTVCFFTVVPYYSFVRLDGIHESVDQFHCCVDGSQEHDNLRNAGISPTTIPPSKLPLAVCGHFRQEETRE